MHSHRPITYYEVNCLPPECFFNIPFPTLPSHPYLPSSKTSIKPTVIFNKPNQYPCSFNIHTWAQLVFFTKLCLAPIMYNTFLRNITIRRYTKSEHTCTQHFHEVMRASMEAYPDLPSWKDSNGVRLANKEMEIQIGAISAQS